MIKVMKTPNEGQVMQPAQDAKKSAHWLIDQLPDDVSWDEIAYRVEVRASIERGLADIEAGRVKTHEEVLKEFGLDES